MNTKIFYIIIFSLLSWVCHADDAFISNKKNMFIKEWEKYEESVSADLPRKSLEILAEIRDKAFKKNKMQDFYEAGMKYAFLKSKLGMSDAGKEFDMLHLKIKSTGVPILEFLFKYERGDMSDILDFISEHETELKKQKHTFFYEKDEFLKRHLNGNLWKFLANDYEFVLWKTENFSGLKKEISESADMDAEINDKNLIMSYIDFCEMRQIPEYEQGYVEKYKKIEDFFNKNKGGTAGFYAEYELLRMRFLYFMSKNDEQGYRKLYEDCNDFLSRVKKLPKSGKMFLSCDKQVKDLVKRLTLSDVNFFMDNYSVKMHFFNTDKAELQVKSKDDGKVVLKTEVINPKQSFYVKDTVVVSLEGINDGEYELMLKANGKTKVISGSVYSINLINRYNSKGYGIFMADAITGKPLKDVQINLFRNGKKISGAKVSSEKGFVPLPERLAEAMNVKGYYFVEGILKEPSGRIRKSKMTGLDLRDLSSDDLFCEYQRTGNIYLDKKVCEEGETLFFKAILYEKKNGKTQTVPEGTKVVISLRDNENSELYSGVFYTDQFGAVSSGIGLPRNLRKGECEIIAESDGDCVCAESFVVGDFIPPDFYVEFNPRKHVVSKFEKVRVSGKIVSYSGHVNSSKISYGIKHYDKQENGTCLSDNSGNFEFTFFTEQDGYYDICVTVTDDKGETHEYYTFVEVPDKITIDSRFLNAEQAEIDTYGYPLEQFILITGNEIRFISEAGSHEIKDRDLTIKYEFYDDVHNVLLSGDCNKGGETVIDVKNIPDGLYHLKQTCKKGKIEGEASYYIIKNAKESFKIKYPVKSVFRIINKNPKKGEKFGFDFISAEPVSMVAELYGANKELLDGGLPESSEKDENGNFRTKMLFTGNYRNNNDFKLYVIYNRNFKTVLLKEEYNEYKNRTLPLEVESFNEELLPGKEYSFKIKTAPGAQCLACIYDKSMDEIRLNEWDTVEDKDTSKDVFYYCDGPMGVSYDAFPIGATRSALVYESSLNQTDVAIRRNFCRTLLFSPDKVADEKGEITFKFKTSDKLSTFKLLVYVHDKAMNNALETKEFTVTLPVKLSVHEPRYLYDGDESNLSVSVSSNSGKKIAGRLRVVCYDGENIDEAHVIKEFSSEVSMEGKSSSSENFNIVADYDKLSGDSKVLGIKIIFECPDFSDGIFVKIPVLPAKQIISESYCKLVPGNHDSGKIYEELQSEFKNGTGMGAVYEEKSLWDILLSSLKNHKGTKSNNVIDVINDVYSLSLLSIIEKDSVPDFSNSELSKKIAECRNADGGYGWLPGMKSSPVITCYLADCFSMLSEKGVKGLPDMDESIKYIDRVFYDKTGSDLSGEIRLGDYLYIRSLYPGVSLNDTYLKDKKFLKIKKEIKNFLVPEKKRGLDFLVYDKAMRAATLLNFLKTENGLRFLEKAGIAGSKSLESSLDKDVSSLLQYAELHKSGGYYFPVSAKKHGFFDYAIFEHSIICNLLDRYKKTHSSEKGIMAGKVADGLRTWMLLQKYNIDFEKFIYYADVVNSVSEGSDFLKSQKMAVLSAKYKKDFDKVKESGNGMKISRKIYREVETDGKTEYEEIKNTDILKAGDKVKAQYVIENDNKASFIKIRAYRESAFDPVVPVSGFCHDYRDLTSYFMYRSIYREVNKDCSVFYLDDMPEGKFTINEYFFVTRKGEFKAPVMEIEACYSKTYKANGKYEGVIIVH